MAFRGSHFLSWKYGAIDVEKHVSWAWMVLVNRVDAYGYQPRCTHVEHQIPVTKPSACDLIHLFLVHMCDIQSAEGPGPGQNKGLQKACRGNLSSVQEVSKPNTASIWIFIHSFNTIQLYMLWSSSRIVKCCMRVFRNNMFVWNCHPRPLVIRGSLFVWRRDKR